MGRKKAGGRKPHVGFRLTADEVKMLDEQAERLAAKSGGPPSRVDVLRLGVKLVAEGKADVAPVTLPHLGDVPCGTPTALLDNPPINYVDVVALIRGPDRYLLTARGNSLKNLGVMDGDYIVVRKADDAESGQTVVAVIDGEATLKVLQVRGTGARKEYMLYPAGDEHHQAIRLDPDGDARIIGVMVGLYRKC